MIPPTQVERVVTTTADGVWAVHARDVDGDGDADLFSASENDNRVVWYEYRTPRGHRDFAFGTDGRATPRGDRADAAEWSRRCHKAIASTPLGAGTTPLLAACKFGHVATARLCLDHGAAVDHAIDVPGGPQTGASPLIISCLQGYGDVARLLLERGTNINQGVGGVLHAEDLARMNGKAALADWLAHVRSVGLQGRHQSGACFHRRRGAVASTPRGSRADAAK